jgi:hypothetical protein
VALAAGERADSIVITTGESSQPCDKMLNHAK